jgi:hypothetical protein
MKRCSQCKEVKTLSLFFKRPDSPDGYTYVCIKCNYLSQGIYRNNNKEAIKIRGREHRRKLRQSIMAAYGNQCACCKDKHQEFLCVDHTNGDGGAHRKAIGADKNPMKMFYWLRDNNFPKKGFRLLCYNCNNSVSKYGYCPHKVI